MSFYEDVTMFALFFVLCFCFVSGQTNPCCSTQVAGSAVRTLRSHNGPSHLGRPPLWPPLPLLQNLTVLCRTPLHLMSRRFHRGDQYRSCDHNADASEGILPSAMGLGDGGSRTETTARRATSFPVCLDVCSTYYTVCVLGMQQLPTVLGAKFGVKNGNAYSLPICGDRHDQRQPLGTVPRGPVTSGDN